MPSTYQVVLLAAALCAGCVGAPAPAGVSDGARIPFADTPARPDGFTIATFNAEFLFDGIGNEGRAEFPWKGDSARARVHRQDVARVVRRLDADIVVLVETEHIGVLQTMIERDLAGMGYTPHLVDGRDSHTGQDVGILSRVPVSSAYRTDDRAPVAGGDRTYGVSKNIVIRFSIGDTPVSLVAIHLLAWPDDPGRGALREAQAEVVRRQVVHEVAAGREVIVAGDFNDYDPAVPDRAGSEARTNVLATIRRAGAGDADDLANAGELIPRALRYTFGRDYNGNGVLEPRETAAVDHVLVSPALRRRARDGRVAHLDEVRGVSDHWPVVVTLGE